MTTKQVYQPMYERTALFPDKDTKEHHSQYTPKHKATTCCDGCGAVVDNFKVRPWRKSFLHPELLLCPKCHKQCTSSDGASVEEVYKAPALIGMVPVVMPEKYKRGKNANRNPKERSTRNSKSGRTKNTVRPGSGTSKRLVNKHKGAKK